MKGGNNEIYLREKEKWLKKLYGEYEEEKIGKCTMPGCGGVIYDDMEYFKDDAGNIFCSTECVCDWYGIVKR